MAFEAVSWKPDPTLATERAAGTSSAERLTKMLTTLSSSMRSSARQRRMRFALLCLALGSAPQLAHAKPRAAKAAETNASEAEPRDVVRARAQFASGAALVRSAQWAEALAAFEESSRLRPHPITTYNIGACQRSLGRYTVAQAMLERALAEEAGGAKLPESLRAEANTYLAEIGRLLVHVKLSVQPSDAAVAVDGRPLQTVDRADGSKILVAGLRAAGRGETLPAASVEVVLDPGTHLLTLSRKGFSDQLANRTFAPGTSSTLTLNLDKLPATLRVSSNEEKSVVRVDLIDVGYAPIEIQRPAGPYMIAVEKPGFSSYETRVKVNPGEEADIKAKLTHTPITQKWWFWSGVGLVVTGAVVGTYFATRSGPAPERPALDGGGLRWTLKVP